MATPRSDASLLRVTIVGAGLSGLTAAIGIQRAGHKVTILDKATQLREIGAGIHIASNAAKVYSHWGLLEELEEVCVKPNIFDIHPWTDERILATTELNPAYRNEFATPYLLTHRVDLQKLLVKHTEILGAQIRLGCSVDKIDFSSATVTLDSGEIVQGDLVIGADGDRSISRCLLENRKSLVFDSGFDVYRCTVSASELLKHADIAPLIRPYSLRMWMGPGAHMILYPLGTHDRMNIVFTRVHPPDQETIWSPLNLKLEDVHEDFKEVDPRIHKIIDIAGACTKRTMLYADECTNWVHDSGRFALFGDAAHASFPYMAQGAAMGIEDAGAISTFLARLETKSQLPQMVQLYEEIRKPRALEMRRLSDFFKDLYTLPDGPEQQARDDALLLREPFDGSPNFLSDPVRKPWIYGYDVIEESGRRFDAWKNAIETVNGTH